MKAKRDYSLLYGVLAGFSLFVLFGGWFVVHTVRNSPPGPFYGMFPDGYQVIEDRDTHFFRDGTRVLVLQIPAEASDSFATLLQENGFEKTPLPDPISWTVEGDPEVEAVTVVTNGLWWFHDRSPEDWGGYSNYDLHVYDLDTGIYYLVESDS